MTIENKATDVLCGSNWHFDTNIPRTYRKRTSLLQDRMSGNIFWSLNFYTLVINIMNSLFIFSDWPSLLVRSMWRCRIVSPWLQTRVRYSIKIQVIHFLKVLYEILLPDIFLIQLFLGWLYLLTCYHLKIKKSISA